jgi:tetracycline resistance efflux pump
MNEYGFLSLLPPLIAIFLAIRTKQVIYSLMIGIFLGWLILSDWNLISAFFGTMQAIVDVFKSDGNTRTVVFTLLIGALIQLIKYSGGVDGFIYRIQKSLANTSHPKRAIQLSAGLTGFLLFIESNISILTVGTAFKPLCDKYGISKEKLAYLADSSSAPSCILFPLNAWGAYIMGLLLAYDHLDPFKTLIYSIPFNFYPLLTLILVFYIASSGKNYGPMKQFESQAQPISATHSASPHTESNKKARNMVLPLLVMVITMPILLIYSGWQADATGQSLIDRIWISIGSGSGSFAVMNAVFIALLFAAGYYGIQKIINLKSFFEVSLKGMNDMLMMAILMVLAFAIGNMCKELGTGQYVADVTSAWLSPALAPAILFLTSCFVAFSTGTSWGTFAIMISIGVPLAQSVGLNPYLAIGAVLGGGVFGDHCSPISDTTLISSVATQCDHIDHVRTQLPYALMTGGIATLFYLITGFLIY